MLIAPVDLLVVVQVFGAAAIAVTRWQSAAGVALMFAAAAVVGYAKARTFT